MLTSRVRRLFEDDRLFWMLMAWTSGFIALGKGLKFPNRWSATQAQVDYHFGFVKRGLFGELISGPLGLQEYRRFAIVSGLVLFVFCGLLVLHTAISHVPRRVRGHQLAALFFSGYGFTYLINLIGYFDVFLAALALAVLLIANPWVRLSFGLPVSVLAILVHELFLFAFLPVLAFSFLIQAIPSGSRPSHNRWFTSFAVLLLVGVSGATAAWTSLRPSLSPVQAVSMRERIQSRVDFPVRTDFFAVMTRSARDNAAVTGARYRSSAWWTENAISVIVFAPTVFVFLIITRKLILAGPHLPRWTATIATLTALSPLTLHLMGWDAARWNALVVLTTYLVFLTVCRFGRGMEVGLSPAWKNGIALVIVLNIASGSLLMDYTSEEHLSVYSFLSISSIAFRSSDRPYRLRAAEL